MRDGAQTMNGAAVRAEQPTKEDGRGKTGEIGRDKAVPPEPFATLGTTVRFFPGKFLAENG